MPPARKEATLSFCHGSRSVRITTAILVSNCMRLSDRWNLHRTQPLMVRRRPGAVSNHVARAHPSRRAQGRTPQDQASISPLGVASPGADHAFLAAEFVALPCRGVERTRNFRFYGVAVGTAGIGHVDGQRRAGPLHGERDTVALALFQYRGARGFLGGKVIGLAVSAALADGEGPGRPAFGVVAPGTQYH